MLACEQSSVASLCPSLALLLGTALFAPPLLLVDPLPLRQTRRSGSIRPAAAHHSILQNSRRMRKQPPILCTFCADVKTYLRLMSCGFPREPRRCSIHESLPAIRNTLRHRANGHQNRFRIVVERQGGRKWLVYSG